MNSNFDRRSALAVIVAGAALPGPALAAARHPAKTVVAAYADAWTRKDLDSILACMAPDVEFRGPNVKADGRSAYRASTERFLALVEQVNVRACVIAGSQAMLAYDFICREPIGVSAVAELVRLEDGRIAGSEIFFDTAPFAAFAQARQAAAREVSQ